MKEWLSIHRVKPSEPASNVLINYMKKWLKEIVSYSFKAPALKILIYNLFKKTRNL